MTARHTRARVRTALVLAGLAAVAVLPSPSTSQTERAPTSTIEGGLWKDQNGRIWCGLTCNTAINQVCCTISY